MRKFFSFSGKILKNLFPAILGPFFVYLDKNAKKKKRLNQFLNITIIYHHAKNQKELMSHS